MSSSQPSVTIAIVRRRMSSSRTAQQPPVTEFDILKASHKFLRDDTEAEVATSWDDQLAKKYYDSLYREFAVCDLKHYKSGNFALRWRTETEVLDGIGETSCANTRCEHHRLHSPTDISTLELPFAYEEHGEQKEALVKMVLCPKCVRKLMWKRRHDKRDGKHNSVPDSTGGDRVASDELITERSPPNERVNFGQRRRSRSPRRRGDHRARSTRSK